MSAACSRTRYAIILREIASLQIFDPYRLYLLSEFKAEDFRVKVEFRFEHAPDVFRFAKAVLFAFKREISNRQFFSAHGFDHFLGLIGRNDFVFQALDENHRAIQMVGEVNRRAFDVEIAPLGIGADQSVEIARLELVGVFGQRFEIADAVVAGAGFENVTKRQRAERRVAAGAAAADCEPIAVDFAAFSKIARAVDAVVDIDDTPLTVEPFSVGASVTGAAAVVDIEYRDASAGPILNRIFQRRRA